MHLGLIHKKKIDQYDTPKGSGLPQICYADSLIFVTKHVKKCVIGWFVVWFGRKILYIYGHVTVNAEVLKHIDQCSVLKACEKGASFLALHLLWQWASVFAISTERLRRLVGLYDKQVHVVY